MGKDKRTNPPEASELRRRAEERLSALPPIPPGSEHENQRLFHELHVHQVELEMQNAELREARDEVESALERYADLYDFAPVGYLTLDRNGTIRAANLAGSGLLGTERSRLNGRRFEQFVPGEGRSAFSAFLSEIFASRDKKACEMALLKQGMPGLFVRIEAVAAESGDECRIVLIDVTERKLAEMALREAKEAAEAATRTKSLFLANMSHELRTPMTGILGMLQLALEEEIAPVPRGYLETSLNSARSLLRILNDILDMAKIESGKLFIEERPFSPRECISEAIDIITSEVRRKGLDLELSVADEVPATVSGDQTRLRQVLINLIGNAVKFTEGGRVTVRVTAGAPDSEGKREITFNVTDTGIGIPDDKKELLFRTFSQVDPTHSRTYGGTGLGLAISREIVELMGGTIACTSEAGVGSTFSFTIPLRETGPESEPAAAAEPEAPAPAAEPGHRPRLLLAEDDPANRQVFEIMLGHAGYDLDTVDDGQKAVERWASGEYDLVLMDVQMPRLDGFEATRAIREKERERGGHTPIVAMTAHARKEDEEICLAAGMDAYLSKPIDLKECLRLIGRILRQSSAGTSSP